jgi:hypothetical protein
MHLLLPIPFSLVKLLWIHDHLLITSKARGVWLQELFEFSVHAEIEIGVFIKSSRNRFIHSNDGFWFSITNFHSVNYFKYNVVTMK